MAVKSETGAGPASQSYVPAPDTSGAGHTGGETFAETFAAAVSSVTSAFGDPTRRDIYVYVRSEEEGATATDVAQHFALHPNVARHHLEKLAAGGYLTVELATGGSAAAGARTAGRPSKHYHVSDREHALTFPPRRDDLLATLLARALEILPADQASRMAEEVGFDYGRSLASRIAPTDTHRSVRAAVSVVADALTAHGFAAHPEGRGGQLRIVSEQCPFGDAARLYPHVVCAVDRGMIRGLMAGLYGETHPRFEASRPDGDARCVTAV